MIDGIPQSYLPIVKEGHTYIPLRSIFESLGAQVQWNTETKMITIIRGMH
ncbi:stalk domain-containing protein [Chengkuizengella axinellae]